MESSFATLFNAALTPPCAIAVAERVGKIFVINATRKPSRRAASKAARWPAPPLPTTRTSYCSIRTSSKTLVLF